jgi:hypothetical protein
MTKEPVFETARITDYTKDILIPQEGSQVKEQEHIYPRRSFKTPKDKWVPGLEKVIYS